MSLVCEISGEPLPTNDEVVVTPSGHVCIKRLLLTKLAENGGHDPFETNRPLTEDQLVILQTRRTSFVPPRPSATSFPNMLGMIQNEYDALVLELFETRKALEETRRELSQALYQNDAAIRVVARISQEKDAIQQQLEQWKASSQEEEEAPQAKRRRVLEPTILQNDIPPEDLQTMTTVWQDLSKNRKPTLKAAASQAPSPETLANCKFLETKAWHKSTNRGIPCISSSNDFTATAGKDKQIVVYDKVEKVVKKTFSLGCVGSCVDIGKTFVVTGTPDGKIVLFSLDGKKGEIDAGSAIVDVRVHPTDQHVVAATADGKVIVAVWHESKFQQISTFQASDETYTAGCIHPDGLIYLAGTKSGKLLVWDFKNKVLAATFQDGEKSDGVTSIAFSNNGYHIGVGYDSATVRFWDLRKQKVFGTVQCAEGDLSVSTIQSVAFDKAGKYVAMGGKGGVKITTVKEWGITGSFETKHPVSGIVWNGVQSSNFLLEVACDGERAVQVYGSPSSDVKMKE